MSQTAALHPLHRLCVILRDLRFAAAKRAYEKDAAQHFIAALLAWAAAAGRRINRMLDRARDGTLAPPRARAPRPVAAGPEEPRETLRFRRPHQRGWMLAAVNWYIGDCATAFRALLADPELLACLATAPQLARVLRPLCHGLEVDPIPQLALPPRPRSEPPPAPQPATQAAGSPPHTAQRAAPPPTRPFLNPPRPPERRKRRFLPR